MSTASEPVGGPAEEARRLAEALGDWAATKLGAADEHIATGAAECQLCPVCQLISALRGDRTEALARLGDAWTAFLGVLSAHPGQASGHAQSAEPGRAPDMADTEPDVMHATRPVQNIDVR